MRFYSFCEKSANTYLFPSNELSYRALGVVSVLATLTKHLPYSYLKARQLALVVRQKLTT